MPTTNPRLNITFLPDTAALLTKLAKHEGKSVASMAKDLIIDALERREDIALSRLADICEQEQKGKKYYTHTEAWGEE